MYDILHTVLNEASTENSEDKGTDFSFSDEGKDPAADEDSDDSKKPENDDENDESDKDPEFSIDGDDESGDNDSGDIFKGDPTEGDGSEDGDDSTGLDDDSTGTDDISSGDEPAEIQPKILNLSKLDSALVKRRLFDQYSDLLSLAYSIGDSINDRKILINQDARESCNDKITSITEGLDMYIKHKFYINNYEINFRNYIIFSKNINDLVDFISSLTKHKNKDD